MLSFILAAATAALPFTPPAGWAQMPAGASHVQAKDSWKGPGGSQTFRIMSFPFPGSAQMLAQAGNKFSGKAKILHVISNKPVTLCGTPSRFVVERVQAAGQAAIMQQEIAVRDGYAYMLMYMRGQKTPASPAISGVMRSFCPGLSGAIPKISPPAGWIAQPQSDLESVGMWMGKSPGEMLMLMKGAQQHSLDTLFQQSKQQTIHSTSSAAKISVQKQNVTYCGSPGLLVQIGMNTPAMPWPITMYEALTQANGAAYVLSYIHMGTAPVDQSAINSLHTLCAKPAAAAAPPTPVPPAVTPSPASSVTPSPRP